MAALSRIRELAAATPAHRNRAADLYRAAALGLVVLGHWLGAAIWEQPDGDLRFTNLLAVEAWTHWATWVFQVIPVFFIVGGYGAFHSLAARERDRRPLGGWLTSRVRRLLSPLTVFVGVWVLAAVIAGIAGADGDLIHDGVDQAMVPLWFLAVYLLVTAAAPLTLAAWRRWGPWTLAAGVTAAVAVDVLRMAGDLEWAGWLNYLIVFGTAYQAGYWWADPERPIGRAAAAGAVGIGLAVLVVLTTIGPYPTSMVAVPPRANFNNALPPTVPMLALGLAQFGLMLLAESGLRRWLLHLRPWTTVVAANAVLMTVYLWHLTAVVIVVGLGILLGVGFAAEPLSAGWWLTRPIWLAALATVLAALVALFGRFETRIHTSPGPRPVVGAVGIAAVVVAIAVTVEIALVGSGGSLRWWVAALYALAAFIWGAYPTGRRNRAAQAEP